MFMTYQTTIYFGEEQEINAPSMHFQNGAYCQKQINVHGLSNKKELLVHDSHYPSFWD